MHNRKTFVFGVIFILLSLAGIYLFLSKYFDRPIISFIIDKSNSLPFKFYIGFNCDFEIQKGDIILFRHKYFPFS